jgi:two-component system, response regulator RegA
MIRGSAVLLADDDSAWVRSFGALLAAEGCDVVVATTFVEMDRLLASRSFGGMVMEPNLPGTTWFQALRALRRIGSSLRPAIVTAFPSRAMIREAERLSPLAIEAKPTCGLGVVRALIRGGESPYAGSTSTSDVSLARLEWEHINERLAVAAGNLSRAARDLGIPRQTLYRKLRKHPPIMLRAVPAAGGRTGAIVHGAPHGGRADLEAMKEVPIARVIRTGAEAGSDRDEHGAPE